MDPDTGYAVYVIRLFHEMRDIQGEGGDKQVRPIDLDEIWFDDDTSTT
ncbi:hypothetical protein FHS26_006923 [Rhizobium pisi]|uniref:Uncharacterized protein n=1 Tax=Rhizobium pisi TaxID=574561 RepID=A0A7W5BU17_9HYPH|nr:hypothetical protein [Rhizobium pisi]MBB3139137.1 hypothetical protein [Rhizobium pisi]